MNLFGNCVICGKWLGEDSYNRQEVISMVGAEGTVVACISHIVQPNDRTKLLPMAELKPVLDKMALAKVAQLQKQ